MSEQVRWNVMNAVLEDTRLSATDKAVYVLLSLRMDATGEYRLGLSYLGHILHIRWHTVRQAIDRLTAFGWIAPINPGTRHITWRLVSRPSHESPVPFEVESSIRPHFTPQDAPRMAMPPALASEFLRICLVQRRLYDAAITSDMQRISEEDRTRWQAEADRLDDMMDIMTRWLARFGGGVPDHLSLIHI